MSESTAPSTGSEPAADADVVAPTEAARVLEQYDGLSPRIKFGVLVVLVIVLGVIFAGLHSTLFHWFEVHTGTVNESGPYYGFWSGFGSDIGEATLVVGVWAAWRHHNCHVKGCARLGRPVDGTPYVACPRHHPAHQGSKRNISQATITAAHRDAQARK
jgi:hypothetical protein